MFVLSLWISSALAFSPDTDVHIGIEPRRIMRFHSAKQHQLRKNPFWTSFLSGEGVGWKARFDEQTGRPYRAWGPPLSMGDVSDSSAAIQSSREFLARNWQLTGVKLSMFDQGVASYNPDLDAFYVHFDQLVSLSGSAYNDLLSSPENVTTARVWRSGVDLRLRSQNLVMLGIGSHPRLQDWNPQANLIASEAAAIAMAEGPAPDSLHKDFSAELVVLPLEKGKSLDYRLCWEIKSQTQQPVGKWVTFVDAVSGELLNVYNEVRFLEGTLLGEHDTRTLDGDMSISPLRFIEISSDSASVMSDEQGAYSLEGDQATVTFDGEHTEVDNQNGSDASLELSGGELIWTEDDATQAEIDQYVFQNQIYDWAEAYAPNVVNNWPKSNINVNLNETCNAYFDGELNFFRSGDGCNNTGRIADVSFHEWGHGFHYYNLQAGYYDGSVSEGLSDAMSFFQTRDPDIAPYFGTSGWSIREVASDRVYPDDIVNEVHADGLIFAGAVWDLWKELEDELGEDEAFEVLMPIFVQALKAGPDIPSSYDEFIFADDDNGNLDDGTPHQCQIIDAFGRHGLGPGGGAGFFSMGHEPLLQQSSDAATYAIQADIVQYAQECVDSEIDVAVVRYSLDRGETWSSADLIETNGLLAGEIPQQSAGSVVEYYLEVEDVSGNKNLVPSGGSINPFSFYVGEVEEIFCSDFEDDNGGFTHELVAGDQQEGADDWMWGSPIGMGGDPDEAASGNYVWGNDLGGGNYNGEYQNDKWNRLTSPAIDVSGYSQVVLSFHRWLQVEDGFYDQAQVLANGEVIWNNHGTEYDIGDEHHQDDQWSPQSILVDASGIDEMNFAYEIISDQGLSMGGWNIDDFCVLGVVGAIDVPDDGDPDDEDSDADSDEANGFESQGNSKTGSDLNAGCSGCSQTGKVQSRGLGLLLGFCLTMLAVVRRRS